MRKEFFTDYCGDGPYHECYREHSGVDHCIEIVDRFGIEIGSAFVLGAATGQVLEDFESAWGIRAWGCEISHWAHERVPGRYRRRIARADMRRLVPRLARRGKKFDLAFSNSLIYLAQRDIPPLLRKLSHICHYLHCYSSTSDSREPGDRFIVTLRSRRWWRQRFIENGFRPTRSWYLWKSVM